MWLLEISKKDQSLIKIYFVSFSKYSASSFPKCAKPEISWFHFRKISKIQRIYSTTVEADITESELFFFNWENLIRNTVIGFHTEYCLRYWLNSYTNKWMNFWYGVIPVQTFVPDNEFKTPKKVEGNVFFIAFYLAI